MRNGMTRFLKAGCGEAASITMAVSQEQALWHYSKS